MTTADMTFEDAQGSDATASWGDDDVERLPIAPAFLLTLGVITLVSAVI